MLKVLLGQFVSVIRTGGSSDEDVVLLDSWEASAGMDV